MAGRLTVCPTPIGNLGDLTPRVRDAPEPLDEARHGPLLAVGLDHGHRHVDPEAVQERARAARVLAGHEVADGELDPEAQPARGAPARGPALRPAAAEAAEPAEAGRLD
ncbi:MAG: hypothetical protein ACKOSO_05370, partial [Actinomycetota bacterium]